MKIICTVLFEVVFDSCSAIMQGEIVFLEVKKDVNSFEEPY